MRGFVAFLAFAVAVKYADNPLNERNNPLFFQKVKRGLRREGLCAQASAHHYFEPRADHSAHEPPDPHRAYSHKPNLFRSTTAKF